MFVRVYLVAGSMSLAVACSGGSEQRTEPVPPQRSAGTVPAEANAAGGCSRSRSGRVRELPPVSPRPPVLVPHPGPTPGQTLRVCPAQG